MKKELATLMIATIAWGTSSNDLVQAQNTRSSSSSSSSYSSSSNTGPGGTSYSNSTSSNSVTLNDTPLIQAIVIASRNLKTPVFLSKNAADVVRSSSQKVTISERDRSAERLMAKMLRGTNLIVKTFGVNLCILSEDDLIDEIEQSVAAAVEAKTEDVKGLIPLSVIQLESALKKPVTLTMFQTPVPFVIQMLEGMAGVKISVPREYQDQFFTQQPMISINAQGQPLSEVLESVASQLRCELDVSQGVVAIRKPGQPK